MLKRIYVHNYRTFVNFEWKLPRACVLVGENGAGKSALIEVLCLLQDVAADSRLFEETGFPSTRTAWLKEPEQTIEVDIDHAGESFRYRLGYRLDNGSSTIREELSAGGTVIYRSDGGRVELFADTARTTIPFDRRRSFLALLEPRPDSLRMTTFRDAIRSIWAIKPDPRRIGGPAAAEAVWLERDLSNFAEWYRARVQEDPDAAAALRTDLQNVVHGFSQLRLEPISAEIKDLRIRFSFGDKTHELGWSKLSDGQRLLVALYGLARFALKDSGLTALDEIENYVAPSEIQPWLRLVGDMASEGNKQLLVVSHHPESINYLAADAVWRMWRDPAGGHCRIEQIEPDRSAGEVAYDLVKLGRQDDE
ncbi:MAG: AAA family ATPase [Pseudomonadota bacterium]